MAATQTIPSVLPSYTVEVAFATNPGGTPTWTDVSAYVRSIAVKRGRQDELARVEAGTATIVLDNADRRFDPLYSSGTHYGYILPMRRVRITLEWNAVTYSLFHGFAESWTPVWIGDTGNDAAVELRCVDLFKSLNLFTLQGPAYSEELTGARIGHVLDTIGWPVGDRNLETGKHTVKEETAETIVGTKVTPATATGQALAYLQEVAAAEPGLIFIAGDGKLTFQDRRHRIDVEGSSAATFDDAGVLGYDELAADYDDANIWNEVTVTYPPTFYDTEGEEILTDSTSQTTYLKRSTSYATKLVRPGEAAAVASLFLFRYKDAHLRFPQIRVRPVASEWATVLPLLKDLSKRVTVNRDPPGTGSLTQDCHVEGFELTLTSGPWEAQLSLDVSPADSLSEFIIGTSTLGGTAVVGV